MRAEEFLEFAELVNRLKGTPRTGWVEVGIENPESVADHVFRVSVLAMAVSEERRLDTGKVLKMAVLHDLHEAITGDIKTSVKEHMEGIREEETEATKKMLSIVGMESLMNVWEELEENKTAEAKLVNELDKIEMFIQAEDYLKKHPEKGILKLFLEDGEANVTDGLLRKVIDKLREERQ